MINKNDVHFSPYDKINPDDLSNPSTPLFQLVSDYRDHLEDALKEIQKAISLVNDFSNRVTNGNPVSYFEADQDYFNPATDNVEEAIHILNEI